MSVSYVLDLRNMDEIVQVLRYKKCIAKQAMHFYRVILVNSFLKDEIDNEGDIDDVNHPVIVYVGVHLIEGVTLQALVSLFSSFVAKVWGCSATYLRTSELFREILLLIIKALCEVSGRRQDNGDG